MPPQLTRRRLLEVAPAVLAYPAISAAQGAVGAGSDQSPQIQLDASINFNDPDIFSFIFDAKTHFDGKPILNDDDAKNFDVVPSVSVVVGKRDQDLYGAKREYYSIRENDRQISEVSAVVLYKQPVILTITSVLLVAKVGTAGMTDVLKTRIISAFSGYTSPQDPIKYATAKMGSDISASMFAVRTAFTLDKKTPNPIEYNVSQRTRLLDMYSNTIHGFVYGIKSGNEPYSLSQYLKDKNVSVSEHPIRVEILTQIPEYKLDSLHQKDLHKPVSKQQEDSAVDALIDGDDGGLNPATCHLQGSDKRRIAAIFAWPEFMVQWIPVRVVIGCISLTLWVPRISVRVSDLVLFACVRHENNLAQAFVDMTLGCLVSSALTAMIVGVLTNFAVAMTTYLALFNSCMANQVACLVPNLILLVESSDWS